MNEEKTHTKLGAIYDPSGEINQDNYLSNIITCKSSLQCPKIWGPAPEFNQFCIKGAGFILFTTKSPEPTTQPDTWQTLNKCLID